VLGGRKNGLQTQKRDQAAKRKLAKWPKNPTPNENENGEKGFSAACKALRCFVSFLG
jgi:hypothetical protein